uniref:Exostosin GT47 domain-containing protein n=1 Tax=Pinguiococcus pyrenoidosus TaxID=172671 RepID=A0A7R9U861_9STRA|mmetsp:Transcript_18686/g.70703  ORF Transcript_18686/g.70703 Transcript_18686/m.70703 type:complete len:368 (+) Transcript_18686:219-1322(+)
MVRNWAFSRFVCYPHRRLFSYCVPLLLLVALLFVLARVSQDPRPQTIPGEYNFAPMGPLARNHYHPSCDRDGIFRPRSCYKGQIDGVLSVEQIKQDIDEDCITRGMAGKACTVMCMSEPHISKQAAQLSQGKGKVYAIAGNDEPYLYRQDIIGRLIVPYLNIRKSNGTEKDIPVLLAAGCTETPTAFLGMYFRKPGGRRVRSVIIDVLQSLSPATVKCSEKEGHKSPYDEYLARARTIIVTRGDSSATSKLIEAVDNFIVPVFLSDDDHAIFYEGPVNWSGFPCIDLEREVVVTLSKCRREFDGKKLLGLLAQSEKQQFFRAAVMDISKRYDAYRPSLEAAWKATREMEKVDPRDLPEIKACLDMGS